MNSVTPSAALYRSPKGPRRLTDHRTQTGRHDQPSVGSQDATQDGEADEVDKFKSKLLTAWNNVKYGWTVKMKTTFSRTSPLCLLGEHYCFRLDGWLWPDAIFTHFVDMEPIRSSSPASTPLFPPPSSTACPTDRGRSNLKPQHHLHSTYDPHQDQIHRDIVRWFSDHPSAPFGLHHMVTLGGSLGKKAGDWYGPSIVAHIMRKALEKTSQVPELTVYVSQDCTVYKADIEQLLVGDDTSSVGKAVIILVPVRLGGETFNPVYKQCLKEFLRMPSCLGIIGGKPKHSLYFIGYQDNYLLYLDPHYCQPYIDTSKDDFPLESFHCSSPRKISITRMDPSCTFAFYARNRVDFSALCDHLTKVLNSPSAEEKYPVFSISEGQAQEYISEEGLQNPSRPPARHKRGGMVKRPSSDEFEFL